MTSNPTHTDNFLIVSLGILILLVSYSYIGLCTVYSIYKAGFCILAFTFVFLSARNPFLSDILIAHFIFFLGNNVNISFPNYPIWNYFLFPFHAIYLTIAIIAI